MKTTKPKIIAVVGPTSSGKTALGIYLAQKLGSLPAGRRGEIISADSRQVYKGLNIGTGKVTKKEMADVPHHLLDVLSPKKIFSSSDFVRLGEKAIQHILKNKHVPIVVGGTGYYTDTLLGRMVIPEVPPNEKLRTRLEKKDVDVLFRMLQKKDPRRARTIEPKHKRRIIRALEIAEALGTNPVPTTSHKYDVLWLGIDIPEKTLHKNIRARLLDRIRAGMVDEAVHLHNPPVGRGLSYRRMRTLGLEYRFLADLLEQKISKEEFVEGLDRAIRNYAKRQMRWFKRNKDIHWISTKTDAIALIKNFL